MAMQAYACDLGVLCPSGEQSTYGLPPVSARSRDLLSELALAPGRLTSAVPVLQDSQRFAVCERKASHQAATNAERVHITMASLNRGWQYSQVATRAFNPIGASDIEAGARSGR